MEINFNIKEQRSTIFMPPIIYNNENYQKVQGAISSGESFLPYMIPNGIPVIPAGGPNIVPTLDWALVNDTRTKQINFSLQKIDVIFRTKSTTSIEFCNKSLDFFNKLIKAFGFPVTRLAYAPTYSIEYSSEIVQGLNKAIFTKNSFCDQPLQNLDIRQNFRLEEKLSQKPFSLNYIAYFGIIQETQIKDNTPIAKNSIQSSFDINTVQIKDLQFSPEDVSSFYNQSPNFADKFIKFYNVI